MNWIRRNAWCFAMLAYFAFAIGCGPMADTPGEGTAPATDGDGHDEDAHAEHSHEIGPNGGALAILGGHQYHAEVLADEDSGVIDVLITDAEFKPTSIDAKELAINMMVDDKPSQYVFPLAETAEGEPVKFSLTDPALAELIADAAWEGDARVAIEIGGTPYSETLAKPEVAHEAHEGEGHDHDAEAAHEGEDDDADAAPVEPMDHDGHDHGVEVSEPAVDAAPEADGHEDHDHSAASEGQ